MASCNINGKTKTLGRFITPEKASKTYKNAKSGEIRRIAILQTDMAIKNGLYRHADFLVSEDVA